MTELINIQQIIDIAVSRVSVISVRALTMARILSLPQVLQDLIAEYNVDHRPQMFPVYRQIMQRNHAPRMQHVFQEMSQTVDRYHADRCDNCMNYVDNYEHTHQLFNDMLVYCSAWCMNESIYDIRKQMKRDSRNQKLSV
jgi:hypothetical protein